MIKIDCPKLVKKSLIPAIALLVLIPSAVFASTDSTINFQGKIVRNDTGYEGLNVTAGSPACVVDGNGNDTCDFQVKYYTAASGGTLLLTESFANVEIGQYNGAFTLSLGSDGSPVAGTYASCEGGTCDNLQEVVNAVTSLYVQVGFSPAGNGSYTETFSRMPIQAAAYALKAKYAEAANTAFQFDTAANSSGYATPSAGMVYYDTTDTTLKVYDGSAWNNVGGSGTGTGSLFTDSGAFTFLTSLTDHFVLGSNSYTEIGADSYSTYLAGLATRAPLSFDMTAERLTLSGSQAQSGLTVYSDYSGSSAWPVVSFKSEDSAFDNVVLQVSQDGTGNIMSLLKGSTEAFVFENPLTFYIHPRTTDPTVYANRLYNVNGTLYWNGNVLGTGSSLWTDAGTYSYLTSTTDDLILGGDSASNAKFFFDVSTGNLGIGTSTPGAKLDIAGSSSTISNTTGDITISPDDTVVIKANDTQADNLMEWQNSTGTVLGLINQNGYATLGSSSSNTSAILTLGASSSSVAQIHLTSGFDVSAPTAGDLWWNGTGLYFYDGSSSVDLLTSGGGGSDVLSSYGSTATGGYINLEHDTNSYDVVASGWICVGGSDNESCSGGNWKNIKDSDLTVTQNLSNQWTKSNTNGIIRSIIKQTDIELAPGLNVGTGADVAITGTFYAAYTLDSRSGANSLTGRTCADMVNYAVTAFNAGGTEATLSEVPSAGCLNAGDEVLIINLQGIKSAYGNVGNYETLKVESVTSSTVTFQTPKTKYYGNGTSDDTNLGTTQYTNQRVMLQRVPNYNGFTVMGSLTVTAFDNTTGVGRGGVLFFRSNGTITVGSGGSITATAKGYAGGTGPTSAAAYIPSGECVFAEDPSAVAGYGGPVGAAGVTGTYSGGGGGGKNGTLAGQAGGSGSTYVASCGGGGGGTTTRYNSSYAGRGGGGGGGGYGTYGYAGGGGSGAANGTATASGAGGSATVSTYNYGGGGGGGSGSDSYANATLTKMFFGGGGGAGGMGSSAGATNANGGNGGKGGGIIDIAASSISVSGSIVANGDNGAEGDLTVTHDGGGGGGAGGSIKLLGATLTGLASVTASGGTGAATLSAGGNGGSGRIATYYGISTSGTTTPAASSTSLGYYSYGVYISPVINTTNAQSYDNLKWESTLNTYGKISVQTRSGATSDPTDGTWEGWKPYTSGTNYLTLQTMDVYTQWTGTNATVATGDVTRPYTAVYGFEDEYENTGTNLTKMTSSTNGGYMNTPRASTDLSDYDYVTLWVRASQAGNTVRIGMGEIAGTEQYEDITIDVANTWQKVYWDISDISSTSRDAITKLRVTNFSTTSNTIYVDNIRAEKLLTTSTGSSISSTPNSYFQYRVIFTTTNLSYQPMLYNISFTYGTGYRIVMYDSNNVRLYNYTGATKYLRLEAVASTGSGGGGGEGFVNGLAVSHVEDGAGAIAFQFNTSSTYSNPTSKLLSVMNNSSEKMYLDSNGNLYVSGTITSGAGLSSALVNNSGSTITSKSLVTLDASVDNAFTTTTVAGAQGAFGVVQGTEVNGDVDGDGNCDDGDTCLVTFEGITNVYLDNASTAIKGEYVYSSTTAGQGHADSGSAQTNGLIGIVSSTTNSGSGYVQMVFDAQNKVTANLYLNVGFDKNAYRDMYLQLAQDYTNLSMAERRGVIESNQSETIMFDNLVDGLKIDSTNSTVGLDYYNQKTGLWGGLALTDSTTDIASNRFFGVSGASLVNTSYYYDRTQTGKVGQDSTIATQINSGIDPFWYKGVSYVTTCTSNCASTTRLSTAYNGALFKIAGTYATSSEHGSINITIASLTVSGITANIASSDGTCSVTGATMTFDQPYSFTAGSCSGGNITITPKRYLYTTGDVFKVASWYVEPTTADDRGVTRDFPQRSILLTTKTASNIYVTIVDYDTQRVWMKFNSNSAVVASANFLVNNADYNFTKTYMRNGDMYVDFSTVNSNVDATVAGFARDDAWALNGSTWYKYGSYLANRNAGSGYTALTNPYTFSSGDGSGASYVGLDYPVFASSTIKGIDSNAEGTSGTYYSNTVTFEANSDKAYLWLNGYIDPSDTSGAITVYASNDNGGNYIAGTLLHTDTTQSVPEYEYSFDFASVGNMYKVKFVMARGSSKKSSVYIAKWGLAQMNLGTTDVNGLFTNENDTVANGSYVEVVHGQNTYELVASGWVFDTALSKWVEVTNTDNGITQNLSNQWNNADTDGIIRSVVKQTDVELAPGVNVGTGADGDITLSASKDINAYPSLIIGRTCADGGDAVNYSVVAFNSLGTEATLSGSGASSGCLKAGDEVLIINLQGTSSAYANVGNYETLRILNNVSGTTVTFANAKSKYYGDTLGSDANIGTSAGTQRVLLQRVPNYNDVSVPAGFTFSPSPWDGVKGGVMFFRANGVVSISGSLSTAGLGYRGGIPIEGANYTGVQGESYNYASSTMDTVNNLGGGGGGKGNGSYAGAGAGAGYGTAGTNGEGGDSGVVSSAGTTYGDSYLNKLYFGSGGGAGGDDNTSETGTPGTGGNGGGIISISVADLSVSGTINSNGGNGTNSAGSASEAGGGGGGAGGSIKILGTNIALGTTKATASGGTGGISITGGGTGDGGTGGVGIIAVSHTTLVSGSTTPTYTGSTLGYYSYGAYISPVINTTNAQSYDNLKWESTLNTYGKISVQTRSGASADPTDGTWEGWKPYTSGTNYTTLQSMDAYYLWVGTNATAAIGDVTRPYTAVYGFEDEYENTGTNLTKVTSSTNGGYMESTITSTDLSSYDYVTLWVRASQTGNTIRIGMGESAGTEQYEDITIDTANTWQKVYWDISDITSTSRDAITKLRITNYSTSSNVIYIDNIRAEKLLTTSTGSNISSTPNSYFQYRVIFTTTNLSYQPMLNNITLVYSTGFKIQIVDANTVRLYNNSGQTQKLRLDVILGSAAIDLSSSQYSLNLAPSAAQIDGGDNTNSIWINKLGVGGNLLKLQTASSDMLVVDSSGNMTLAGDVSISGGSIDLGSEGATIRYNSTSNTIEFSNDGVTWLALGDITRQVVLSAEYPGAVLSGDGTDNTGAMVSDNTGSSSNSMNYYEWSSSAVSLNDYDVRVRFTLPSDFSGWGSTGGVTLNLATESTSSSNNKVDMYIYKEGSATIDGTSEGNASSSAGVWKTTTIAGTDLNECATAGDTCVFILRMSSMNDNYVRVGDIEITYNRSL